MTETQGENQDLLVARLRREAAVREEDLAHVRAQLATAERELLKSEHELHEAERERDDLRAIRDALTPPALPVRPGLDLAATFLPAGAERVSGDFYLVAEGPDDATILVIGDVVGHGLRAARQAAFVRTALVATAPFSRDPCQLLTWANVALMERVSGESFVTAACLSYESSERTLQWAYAGHPSALWLADGSRLKAPGAAPPLGVSRDLNCTWGSRTLSPREGFLLYTDGLIEARSGGELFGLEGARAALAELHSPTPAEVVTVLRQRVKEFVHDAQLSDDLCLLAACID